MRTLLHWVARLYPAEWRARYGQELDGLVDDIEPSWQDVLDVAKGGLQMRLKHSVVRLTVVSGMVGVCVAGVLALTLPKQFVARGVVFMEPTAEAADPVSTLKTTTLLSGDELRSVLDAHNLFPSAGYQREKRLRDSVYINLLSKNAFRVSFGYPDAGTAQQVTRDLMVMIANAVRANTDLSRVAYEEPNVPRTAEGSNSLAVVAMGLLGGSMLGMVTGIVWRWVRPSM